VGVTLHATLLESFRVPRVGDRFWYQRVFPMRVVRSAGDPMITATPG
jgi:hypothetical protein